jgi:GNAT superfamily N-acetyltransferase
VDVTPDGPLDELAAEMLGLGVAGRPKPHAPAGPTPALRFRHPTEVDHTPIVTLIDDWWGGRRLHDLLPRLWLQHFCGTSWLAETEDGRLAGFLVGFVSPDHPETAYVHLVATNPNLRSRGVGRALEERFFATARERGAHQVRAIGWAGDRGSIAFHRALGYRIEDGPETRPIYGVPAHEDYDAIGDEKVLFVLAL